MSTTGLKMSLFATVMLSCMHKEPTPVVEDPAVPVEYATTPACLPDWPCQGDLLALIRKTKVSFESNRATLTVVMGVDPERIATISYGFHKRVGEPQNADARTMSRSDDFSVKGVGVAAALNP